MKGVFLNLRFQGEMCASPDIFAHLTHLLMNLAGGKLCAVLEVRLDVPEHLLPSLNTYISALFIKCISV